MGRLFLGPRRVDAQVWLLAAFTFHVVHVSRVLYTWPAALDPKLQKHDDGPKTDNNYGLIHVLIHPPGLVRMRLGMCGMGLGLGN